MKLQNQLETMRAEWAKAPFMTRQMAGAYVGPMLDLIEGLIQRTEAQNAALLAVIGERVASLNEVRALIVKAEALGALPGWMIEHAKRAAGGEQ
jgi:hypothetical protein